MKQKKFSWLQVSPVISCILSISAILLLAFPSFKSSAAEEAATIFISTSNDYLRADNFSPNGTVTFTVYESLGSSQVVFEISLATDDSGHAFIDGWEHNADLLPGQYAVATDGITEKQLVLEPVTIEVFDPETDFVAGTASPGRSVWVVVGNDTIGYPGGKWAVAGDDGAWTADFALELDITYDMWGSAVLYDEDGDSTVYHAGPPPSPWLIAFPEIEAVEGWEWPEGATIYLTIDHAPGLELEGTAAVTTWGDTRTYVRFEFADLYDLKVGDTVTLTDGVAERSHVIRDLAISAVDQFEDKITGTANPGALVQVWPHGFDETATVQATAGQDGVWLADFAGLFDLAGGTGGRSQILDESGNATAVDWSLLYLQHLPLMLRNSP